MEGPSECWVNEGYLPTGISVPYCFVANTSKLSGEMAAISLSSGALWTRKSDRPEQGWLVLHYWVWEQLMGWVDSNLSLPETIDHNTDTQPLLSTQF